MEQRYVIYKNVLKYKLVLFELKFENYILIQSQAEWIGLRTHDNRA
jgi:hypothetical protein